MLYLQSHGAIDQCFDRPGESKIDLSSIVVCYQLYGHSYLGGSQPGYTFCQVKASGKLFLLRIVNIDHLSPINPEVQKEVITHHLKLHPIFKAVVKHSFKIIKRFY